QMTSTGSNGATTFDYTFTNGSATTTTTDQRGLARTFNGTVDIGAYEAVTVTVTNTTDVVNGTTTSIAALIASPGADGISLREALLATNASAGGDYIGFS